VRYFFTRRQLPHTRLLLIESGSRALAEGVLPLLHRAFGPDIAVDLVTCYAGLPAGYSPDTVVYRVTDYNSRERRTELIQQLRRGDYTTACMICSAESIMTKWKWLIAFKVPAKFLILNENGDFFWVHRDNLSAIRHFILFRAGLSGAGAIRTVGRLLIFPFSVLFLLLYAFAAHARRILRSSGHKV
jgi:hypothetical protein